MDQHPTCGYDEEMLRSRFVVGVLLGCLGCGAAEGAVEPPKLVMRDVRFQLFDEKFRSGLRVVIEEDHRAPAVAVVSLVGAGFADDPPGKSGLAHFVEHLAFRSKPDGATSARAALAIAGADMNAETTIDHTAYLDVGPSAALADILKAEGARLVAPVEAIPDDVFDVEREVVRSEERERGGGRGTTSSVALAALRRALFPSQDAGAAPMIGGRDELDAIRLEDAKAFTAAHYRPSEMTMVIVGDVDSKSAAAVVEASLPQKLTAGDAMPDFAPRIPPIAPMPPDPPPAGPSVHLTAKIAKPEAWIGWTLPRSFDANAYRLELLQGAVFSAFTSGRVDTDISSVSVYVLRGRRASMLVARVALRSGDHVERTIDDVLDHATASWRAPTSLELSLRVRQGLTSLLLAAESPVERGIARAEFTHFSGDLSMFSRQFRALFDVRAEDVNDLVKQYLTRARARSVFLTPAPETRGQDDDRDASRSNVILPAGGDEPAMPPGRLAAAVAPRGFSSFATRTLPNGMRVVVAKRPGLPIATVGLEIAIDGVVAEGRAARLFARPADWRATWSRVVALSSLGAQLDEDDSNDHMRILARGPSANAGDLIDVLASALRDLKTTVNAQSLRSIVNRLAQVEQRPNALAGRALAMSLFPGHPLGAIPNAVDYGRLDPDAVEGWLASAIAAPNMTVVVAGEVDSPDVLARVEHAFGGLGGVASPEMPAPPSLGGAWGKPQILVTNRPESTGATFTLSCRLPDRGTSAVDRVAASVVGSRLNDVMRERIGASYGVHASVYSFRGAVRAIAATGQVEPAHVKRALFFVRSALGTMRDGPPADAIERARSRVARSYAAELFSNDDVVNAVLDGAKYGRTTADLDLFGRDLIGATRADITHALGSCFEHPIVSLVGDEAALRATAAEVWP